jgi:hypothetical protein
MHFLSSKTILDTADKFKDYTCISLSADPYKMETAAVQRGNFTIDATCPFSTVDAAFRSTLTFRASPTDALSGAVSKKLTSLARVRKMMLQ